MDIKYCNGCQTHKKLTQFWLKHGKPQARCKECQKKYHKAHYANNKKAYLNRAKVRNKQVEEFNRQFINAKKIVPCMDCGVSYPPYVMDFDHRDPNTKISGVSEMAIQRRTKLETLSKEIEKCDIVCSNCHRERTHQRRLKMTR